MTGLAFLNCVIGAAAFFLSSFLTSDVKISVLLMVSSIAFVTIVFGWRLANDVLDPLNKLSLAAKSLERSPTASLPRTTGSMETDELLDSIRRSCKQIQELVSAMDQISAGRVDSVRGGTNSFDRLDVAFQTMVGKIADSITAREGLDRLEAEIRTIDDRLVRIRGGELELLLHAEHPMVRPLTEAINYIAANLSRLSVHIRHNSASTDTAAAAVRSVIRQAIADAASNAVKARTAVTSLRELPEQMRAPLNQVSSAFASAEGVPQSIGVQENLSLSIKKEADLMKHRLGQMISRAETIREKLTVFPTAVRVATEVSKRAGILAMNANIGSVAVTQTTSDVFLTECESIAEKCSSLAKTAAEASSAIDRDITFLDGIMSDLRERLNAVTEVVAAGEDNLAELRNGTQKLFAVRESVDTMANFDQSGHDALAQTVESSLGTIGGLLNKAEEENSKVVRLSAELRQVLSDIGISEQPALVRDSERGPLAVELAQVLDSPAEPSIEAFVEG